MISDVLAFVGRQTIIFFSWLWTELEEVPTRLKRADAAGENWFIRYFNGDRDSPHKPLYNLLRWAFIAVLLVFAINFLFGSSKFGEWGDFFGGVLNPLLTFLMFMGLLFTIVLQQSELRATREEIARSTNELKQSNDARDQQIFEAAFFQMLSLHNEILASIHHGEWPGGRNSLSGIYGKLKEKYHDLKRTKTSSGYDAAKYINHAYSQFWAHHNKNLGHYFRFLYNIIKFADSSKDKPIRYIRLLRAQLSDQELYLIFYNCLSHHSEGKFKPLVEKYALFNNMPDDALLDPSHKDFFEDSAYELPETPEPLTDSKPQTASQPCASPAASSVIAS